MNDSMEISPDRGEGEKQCDAVILEDILEESASVLLSPNKKTPSPIKKFIMRRIYRVEAFIVPKIINEDELSTTNEIDDVKIANSKLNLGCTVKSSEALDDESKLILSSPKKMSTEEAASNEFCNPAEPIYDVPCIASSLPTVPVHNKYDDAVLPMPPKIPVRTSSLMSIDERGETDGILEEFCFHGYKNGCTAVTQRPEQVSEEVFQDNWLRRLEGLREREANLSERETLLQERERLLFKKERELRILERLVREKLKQADLHLKLCQSSHSIESNNFEAKTKFSEAGSQKFQRFGNERAQSNVSGKQGVGCVEKEYYSVHETEVEDERTTKSFDPGDNGEKGCLRNPPNSRSSLWTTNSGSLVAAREQLFKTHGEFMRNSFPASSGYSSVRMCKPKTRPKISYDDLDSTLSADVGDSSYVATSKKFDPAIFKKPPAFTRSSSERRPRLEHAKDSHLLKYPQQSVRGSVDEKILKRVGENLVASQKDTVKYQDYGLIDERIETRDETKKSSYLNLERGPDATKLDKNPRSSCRDRPISWNEESNEWLRKKRQAYNLATMKLSNENFENKENSNKPNDARERLKKAAKKDSKPKKFGIFR